MSAGGWIMLIASWAVILALNVFCFYKLLTEKPAEPITEEPPSTEGQSAPQP